MYIEKDIFETWMKRIMDRFDQMEKGNEDRGNKYNLPEGKRLLDNQDICQLLNVSKRTLQRYRSLKQLPYHTIYHKTYYKESDVLAFIKNHFDDKDCENKHTNNRQS
ncbi:transcriptional regulator [Bacteroidia bacterium]|nr:transcriptional regulator [Bacteroidia bacterium]